MAVGDIVSDEDLNAMGSPEVPSTPAPLNSPPSQPIFSDADIAAMEDQSKAIDSLNFAAAAVAPPSPLAGPSSPSPYTPTGLGPTQPKTFTTQELDHLEADSLNDPSVDLSRDQWDSAMAARKRVGGSFLGSALSNTSGWIGGLIQTAYGGIKDLMHTPQYNGDFGDYAQKTLEHETSVANSWLQGVRNAGMQTKLLYNRAKQGYQGLVDGSADAGLANATADQIKAGADAGYSNYLDNNAFQREIEHPTISSVPQIVAMLAPDDASGQKVEQALAASFNNPDTAPLKDLTDLSAMVAAPENQVAGAAGALISKVPIGNMVKYASGRVLQGLGNTTIVANDALDSVAKAAIDRVNAVIPSVKIGDKVYDGADIAGAGIAGGAGLVGWSGASHDEEGRNPLWSAMKPVLGYLALRKGAAVVRTIGQGAQVTGTILREASDVMGPLRQDALGAIASNPAIPEAYRTAAGDAVATGGTGAIDSTMSRVANSPDYPAWVRRVAAKANNPILTSAVRGAGSAVEGGIAGSLAMIPLTIGQDEEQAGATVGAGFGFGAVGGLASRVLGNSARQRNQDVARFLADTAISGGDVVKVAQLPAARLHNLAAIQGLLSLKGTDVIPVGAAEFDKQVASTLANQPSIAPADVVPLDGTDFSANVAALGGRGAAGWFLDAVPSQRARVFINLDAAHPAEIHEGLGHAILASNVMDGAQRSDARNFIQQLYGDAGIEDRAREYAQRQVEADEASLRQRAAGAGQPIPSFPPMEDRITQRVEQLSNNGLAAGDEHPLDWARDEVFAEHMNQAGIDVNSIRKGLPANVDPDAATRSILAMNARSLEAQGVSIDPQTGKVVGSLSSIFRDNPLVGSSPTLSKQLARYVSAYDGWLNGIDLGAKRTEGTQIAPSGSPYDMARSNLVNLRPVPGKPGVFGNDFLRNDNGTVTFKSQAEIKQTDDLRKAQLTSAVGTALRAKNDPVLGPRMVKNEKTGNLEKVISGSQLPATMGALQHFGPWIQSIANTFRNDAGQGGVYRMKVNRVGTGESGSYKVINLGNIRSITRNFWEPFEYSVSKEGHLLAHTIDDSAVQRNILKGINEGLFPFHSIDAASKGIDVATSMRQSLQKYLDNHKENLPGENGIGEGKRKEINAVLTSFSKNHRNINPLASNFGPQGVVRRIRMDRIEDMNRVVNQDKNSATYGQPLAGFHFDYFKVNNNMMPDVFHGTNPSAAKEIQRNGFDVTKSADGSIWFTDNKKQIESGSVAASGRGSIIKRFLDEDKLKLGGWAEADKYSTDQLLQMGYDGLKLPGEGETTYQVFNPEKLSK